MKNNNFILFLLPLLVACNNGVSSTITPTTSHTPSSIVTPPTIPAPSLDLASELESLGKGVKLSVLGSETYNNKTTKHYYQTASKSKEFSFIEFKDETRTEKGIHEYYVSNGDQYIYATRLDMSNKYNYYKVYNTSTYEYYKWSDGYDNVISQLKVTDFTKVNGVEYQLNSEAFANASPYLSTLFYGNPGLNFTSLTVSLKDEKLLLTASASFDGSLKYDYEFYAEVLAKGNAVEMDYRMKPFDEVSDPTFEKMLTDLKGNNYTALITNSDGFEETESFYLSNPDKITYITPYYASGYYVTSEGLIQEVTIKGEDFYKVGAPIEADLSEVMPSFDVSRSVFDYSEGVYSLKAGVEGDMMAFTVLETLVSEVDELTIEVTEDGYEVTNISGDEMTKVQFFDIGTTDVGYTEDTVLEPVLATSWADVLTEDDYQLIVDIAGEEAASLIPVPAGYSEWYQLSEEPEFVMLAALASDSIDDDIFGYYLQLVEAGFYVSEEEGFNGGIMGLMEVEVNDEYHVLVVEFLEYEGMFCILIYIGE